MSFVREIVDILPNVVINSGDETRSDCAMDLFEIILKNIGNSVKKRYNKIRSKNYVVPFQEIIYISCLDRRITYSIYSYTTTDEIINAINGWINLQFPEMDYFIMHGPKPLRSGFTLKDFGINHGSHVQVQVRLRGGCLLNNGEYEPYSESIKIQEKFMKFEIQNNSYAFKKVLDGDYNYLLLMINQYLCKKGYNNTKIDGMYLSGLFEDILFFYKDYQNYGLYNSVVRFLKYRGYKTYEVVDLIIHYIGNLELHNDEKFDISNIWEFLQSEFFKQVFGLISFIVLKDNFKDLKLDLHDKSILELIFKYGKALVFNQSEWNPISAVFRNISFVLTRVYRWIKTGDINALYNDYYVDDKWFEESIILIQQSQFLANPEAHGIDIFNYLFELDLKIEIGENNLKTFRGDNKKKLALSKMVSELRRVRGNELTKRAAMKPRKCPMSLLVYATSSTGKSTFLEILFCYYGKLFGLNTSPEFKYTRQSDDPYWSNFRTYCWCVVLDDAAFMKPEIATNGDPSVMEVIKIRNNVVYVTPQAELQDKGNVPMRCNLFLATTNSEDINAPHYFSCPLAVQRRFPFVINLTVKHEYGRDDSREMLDSSKVPTTTVGQYPDLWNIVVKKVEANHLDNNQAILREICQFNSIDEFLVWFGKESIKHEKEQDQMGASIDVLRQNNVCKQCFYVENKCKCVELQNYENEFYKETTYNFLTRIIFFTLSIFTTIWFCTRNYKMLTQKTNDLISTIYYLIKLHRLKVQWIGYSGYLRKFNLKYKKQVAGVLALIGAVYFVTKLIDKNKKYKFSEHGLNESKVNVTTPKFEKSEDENVWYNKTIELVPNDLPKASQSVNDINQFKSLISRNTALLRISNEEMNKVSDGQAFNIYGNIWVTNMHNVERVNAVDTVWLELIRTNSMGVNNNIKCRIDPTMLRQIRGTDLVAITVLASPPGKNFLNFVADGSLAGVHEGYYVFRDKQAKVYYKKVSNIKIGRTAIKESWNVAPGYVGVPNEDTIKGESGGVLILVTPRGPALVGLHQAGCHRASVAVAFFRGDFPDKKISEGDLQLGAQGYERTLGDLHPKSVPRWVESGTCNVYGTLSGFRPKPKSSVQKSHICDTAVKYGYTVEQGAPIMSGWEPWHIAFKPMVNMPKGFKYEDVAKCTDAFIRDVQHLDLKLGYLSLYESINGISGVKYIDGINRNSSMGHPWCSSKKNFLIPNPTEDNPDGVKFPDEINERIEDIEQKYLNGESCKPIFTGHLKDEPRSFKKIKEKKTRVFAGAPIDWSIVVRKALLTFVKAFQENREAFEAAPGLNCQSMEWHNLYLHMTQFGTTNFVAGDYANFDKSMHAMFIMEAFRMIKCLHEINGCGEAHLQIIDGIAIDTTYNYQNFNGDIIQFFGSNPSGHPLTVVINSIVNALYMRFVYAKLNPEGFKPEHFKRDVILMTYGDDNFMNVRDGCDWFNHTSIQKCLEGYGIKYTMADKEAVSIPYINISEVSFLKRTFRYDEDLKVYLAPLEHSSLNKMLTVQVKSKSVSSEAQSISAIHSAIREYFFYGREVFNERREILNRIIEDSGLHNYLIDNIVTEEGEIIQCSLQLPTWEELRSAFLYNSRHLTDVERAM